MCGSRVGTGGPDHPPVKSQVIRVSIEIGDFFQPS